MTDLENIALDKAAVFGIHPQRWPLGDDHHTDIPFTEQDKALGAALAWFLGTNYSDIESGNMGKFFYSISTPIDEWSRVARALRVHGLKICDDK